MPYLGQPPFQEFANPPTKDSFTGDGSTTTFDMNAEVPIASENALEVYIDNVRQEPGSGKAFTLGPDGSGDQKRLTFSAAPANGASIYVINDKTNVQTVAPVAYDLNGTELILDGDADTSITADSDDRIDFLIGGTDHFHITTSSGDTVFQTRTDAKDFKFNQYDGRTILEVNDAGYVALGNGSTGAGELRIYEDTDNGSNYSAFTVGTQSGDVTYTLPTADGSSGQGLVTNGSGTLSWSTLSANTPSSADGQALGSASLEWSDLFLADGAVINLGADQDTTLTHVADTGILLNSTRQLQFGDSGTYIHQSADGVLDLVSDTEIEINATTVDINGAVDVSGVVTAAGFTIGSAVIAESELEQLDGITAGTVLASKAVVVDANKDAGTFRNITLSGELDAATLDISGNADIDGTTNLDEVDIDGAVQIDGATTFGVDDTGVDVKFFGATTGAYLLWDESQNKLLTAGGTVIDIVKDKLMIGSTAVTTTAAELNILDGDTSASAVTVADADRVILNDGGTMKQVAMTDLSAYFDDEVTALPNVTSLGTLTTLTVDNMTFNGNTLTTTSANFIIDASHDIQLDADGGDFIFSDAGTEVLHITNSSTDVVLETKVQDKDFIIKGNDGGSTITPFTLDMSAGGDLFLTGGLIDLKNDGSAVSQIKFYCESSNAHAQTLIGAPHSESATNTLTLPSTGGNSTLLTATSTATLTNKTLTSPVIDTITRTGDFTIDASGDIILDADGGDIFLKDDGTTFGTLSNDAGFFDIKSTVSNQDISFKGNDGGSAITALRLDMSDAGTAIFNHDIKLVDNAQVLVGTGEDLVIKHDGSNSFINNGTGNLTIDAQAGDADIIFKGTDGSTDITALTLDMSDEGTAIFQHDIIMGNDNYIKSSSSDSGSGIKMDAGGYTNITFDDDADLPGFRVQQNGGSYGGNNQMISSYMGRNGVTTSFPFTAVTNANASPDIEWYVRSDGQVAADGSFSGGGADYAEFFEWKDGNSSDEDRRGYSVVLDGDKIVKATDGQTPIGVISGRPAVVGDSDILHKWKSKYLTDDYGSPIMETYTIKEWTDADGNNVWYETDKVPDGVTVPDDAVTKTKDDDNNTFTRKKLNPDWNKDTPYVMREFRKEWDTVGLMGKLRIRKGQPTASNWIKMRDVSDAVEEWLIR